MIHVIQIRPVSDLRNRFSDIEKIVNEGEPVYLTKNGYGTMVILSLEAYSRYTDKTETALDAADAEADSSLVRLKHEEVFDTLRKKMHEK